MLAAFALLQPIAPTCLTCKARNPAYHSIITGNYYCEQCWPPDFPISDDVDYDCACHLPLGSYVDPDDGRAYYIEYVACVGHRWYMLPFCVKCGCRFASPEIGDTCCVCLRAAQKITQKARK